MTSQGILAKAIEKAIANGWKGKLDDGWISMGNLHARIDGLAPKDIIFNHNFAKALWKDAEMVVSVPPMPTGTPISLLAPWQYHLQQMVIADDPIKYLGENL